MKKIRARPAGGPDRRGLRHLEPQLQAGHGGRAEPAVRRGDRLLREGGFGEPQGARLPDGHGAGPAVGQPVRSAGGPQARGRRASATRRRRLYGKALSYNPRDTQIALEARQLTIEPAAAAAAPDQDRVPDQAAGQGRGRSRSRSRSSPACARSS